MRSSTAPSFTSGSARHGGATRPPLHPASIAAIFPQRVVIGMGDVSVSNNSALTLSTYGLGSCVAVAAYDPVAKSGGLLHVMLPESALSPAKATAQPAMFADTGMALLFRSLAGIRVDTQRLRILVAGGASVLYSTDSFRIGERNASAILHHLADAGLAATRIEIGGTVNRTVHLNIGTGAVVLKTPESRITWSFAA